MFRKKRNRIVIVGQGMVTPLGNDTETTWSNMIRGQSGVGYVTLVDPTKVAIPLAAEVKGNFTDNIRPKYTNTAWERICRSSRMGLAASFQALEMINLTHAQADRISVFMGMADGDSIFRREFIKEVVDKDREPGHSKKLLSASKGIEAIPNMPAAHIAMHFGLFGPNLTITTACSASLDAIAEAHKTLIIDDADLIVCGGAECLITDGILKLFSTIQVLASCGDQEDPRIAPKPFDQTHNGFVLAEAGVVFAVTTEKFAKKNDYRILGELLGYGQTSDANYNTTQPRDDGLKAQLAMEKALNKARIPVGKISLIVAHGSGTKRGDDAELLAIQNLLGPRYKNKVAITAPKSSTGHPQGAAGAMGVAVGLNSILTGTIPPILNLRNPIDGSMNFISETTSMHVRTVLINGFGLGGQNTSIVIGEYTE
jgi:3-oxoacyl-[acyl-carrier-protein] synthase II